MSDTLTHAAATAALISTLALGFGLPPSAHAQTASPLAQVSLTEALQLDDSQRAEVEAALRIMPPDLLYLTFARIHAAFRAQIGQDDLRPARLLVDYALLTEAEMATRGLPHPASTETASDMLMLYELVM